VPPPNAQAEVKATCAVADQLGLDLLEESDIVSVHAACRATRGCWPRPRKTSSTARELLLR
jgi:hypothetical protein